MSTSAYSPGEVVPSHFEPAIVAASYFASLCGCLLTVELLHRRGTALQNVRSWLENFGCAVAFGVIGIWCMHFIGNRAIILDQGQPNLQLVYAPGYTTLSVFLPVIGLTIAFAAAELPAPSPMVHWLALTVCGVVAGLSVTGMHYVGNFGVTNYKLHYNPHFLTASVIIAIGDCLGVLVLFYTLRDKWINSWWKRIGCAASLAGGVSAMHFTAAIGCRYVLKMDNHDGAYQSRNVQVLVAGILCGAAAVIVFGVLLATRHRTRLLKKRAQKVVLACAIFDPDGKLLVTTEGTLPTREITDKYNHNTFSEDFNTSHTVLQWLFRVSYNWTSITDLVPKMKSHIGAQKDCQDEDDESTPISSSSSAIYDPSTYSDYSVVFRERFCVAASDLASTLKVPLEKLGILYDRIVETGTLTHDRKSKRISLRHSHDTEYGIRHSFSTRGQVLFLVSQIDGDNMGRLLNAGFKFAPIHLIGRNIAESLQIPLPVFEKHCADLRRYVRGLEVVDKPGTWLSIFAPIAKAHGNGFDLVVNRTDQNQLPDVQLLSAPPQQWQHDILAQLDSMKPSACVKLLERQLNGDKLDAREHDFVDHLVQAIQSLALTMPPEWFRESYFYAKPLYAPYSRIIGGHYPFTILYSFIVMADMHTTIDNYDSITRVPLTFFGMRQRCYNGSPDHQMLARDIHQEFGPLLGRRMLPKPQPKKHIPSMSMASKKRRQQKKNGAGSIVEAHETNNYFDTDSSSEHELVNGPVHKIPDGKMAMMMASDDDEIHEFTPRDDHNIWGGILVDSETVVERDGRIDYIEIDRDGNGYGFKVDAGTGKQEDTFVDELLNVARARFLSPRTHGH